MQQRLKNLKNSFLFFLELQLLISVVMLPILIAWGLPISTMTILGNLIFAQFLTVFIFLSALLFTCDLLSIPQSWIAQALDWVAHIWHYFLSFGSAHWLVGFSEYMLPFAFIFAIAACALYHYKNYSQNYRIICLSILCAGVPLIHCVTQRLYIKIEVIQGAQKMYIIKNKGKIYAFDCGALGARPSSQSWIEYTLTSAMIKGMGATHIDTLVLCKSNSRTKQAAQYLMDHIPVSQLINLDKNYKFS